MGITPYINELYQINDESSLYHLKKQYKTFIDSLANSSFNNIIKNSHLDVNKNNQLFSWETDDESITIKNKFSSSFYFKGNNRFFRQNLNGTLFPNTNYTILLDYNSNNTINFSIETESSDIIIDIINNFSSNVNYNLTPPINEDYKRVLIRFKTTNQLKFYRNQIYLQFKDILNREGAFIEIKNLLLYASDIEMTSNLRPSNTYFLEDIISNVDISNNINSVLYHKLDQEIWCVENDISANFIVILNHLKYVTGDVYTGKALSIFLNGNRLTYGREYIEECFDMNISHLSKRILFRIPVWKDDELVFKNDLLTLTSNVEENKDILNTIVFNTYIPYNVHNIQVINRDVLNYNYFSSLDLYKIGNATINKTNLVGLPNVTDFSEGKVELDFYPSKQLEVYINGIRIHKSKYYTQGQSLHIEDIPILCNLEVFHINEISKYEFNFNLNNTYTLSQIFNPQHLEVYLDGKLVDQSKYKQITDYNLKIIHDDYQQLLISNLIIKNNNLFDNFDSQYIYINEKGLKDKISIPYNMLNQNNIAIYFDGVKVEQNKFYLTNDAEVGCFPDFGNINCDIVFISNVTLYNMTEIETWNFNKDIPANFILELHNIKYATNLDYTGKCLDVILNGKRLTLNKEYLEETYNLDRPQLAKHIFFRIPIWKDDVLVIKSNSPKLLDEHYIGKFNDNNSINAQIIKYNDLLI